MPYNARATANTAAAPITLAPRPTLLAAPGAAVVLAAAPVPVAATCDAALLSAEAAAERKEASMLDGRAEM